VDISSQKVLAIYKDSTSEPIVDVLETKFPQLLGTLDRIRYLSCLVDGLMKCGTVYFTEVGY
jgi:hypothetical protein